MKPYESNESSENYLEAVLVLNQEKGHARSIDVVNYMGFSKPSVSIAMKNLREHGYVEIDSDGFITLTEEGNRIARQTYEKHTLISQILISLGVDSKTATQDACRIEHVLSQQSFQAIKDYFLTHRDHQS